MKRKRHTPEQVIRRLRQGEELQAQGVELSEVLRRLEISTQTYHRWKKQYLGMTPQDAARLKFLEKENRRLKKIVADLSLDVDMLKEVAEGKF
jgi:methylphosphotriester-DNA--protein-cysteine methyltransferase